MILTDWEAVGQITSSILDAQLKLGPERKVSHIYSWPQTWSDSACGFPGGMSCKALWEAQTVVLAMETDSESGTQIALVYHNGRFAYLVEKPSDAFWESFGQLPGVSELTQEGVSEGLGYRVISNPDKAVALFERGPDDSDDDGEVSF